MYRLTHGSFSNTGYILRGLSILAEGPRAIHSDPDVISCIAEGAMG